MLLPAKTSSIVYFLFFFGKKRKKYFILTWDPLLSILIWFILKLRNLRKGNISFNIRHYNKVKNNLPNFSLKFPDLNLTICMALRNRSKCMTGQNFALLLSNKKSEILTGKIKKSAFKSSRKTTNVSRWSIQ
jgi:hypothetical protein